MSGIDRLIDEARALNALAEVDLSAVAAWGALPKGSAPLVLVKDNIAVAGLPWTGGCPLFADVRATRDASAVRLLRAQGASLPIKTTLHELAFGVTGANGWTGAIRNPHDPARIAGGSSGGSAAALAIGLGDLSLVTDTGGSARLPAALCGVIGFRPSTGRYPADGLIGLTPSRDTVGLMAREISWIEWADAILAGEEEGEVPAARSLAIGVAGPADLGELEPDVIIAYREMQALLEAAGHRLVPVDLAKITALDEACGFPIALHQTRETLQALAPDLAGRSLADLLATVATPDVAHLLALAADPGTVPAAVYADAIGRDWPALRAAYAELFDAVDILFLPTTPVTAPLLGCEEMVDLNGQPAPAFPTLTRFTRPDSMAGIPAISLPFGADRRGLPIGMMFSAARHADRALLAFATGLLGDARYPEFPAPNVSFP